MTDGGRNIGAVAAQIAYISHRGEIEIDTDDGQRVSKAGQKQGDTALAGEVRKFAKDLPPVLTDRERIATELVRHVKAQRSPRTRGDDLIRKRTLERTR